MDLNVADVDVAQLGTLGFWMDKPLRVSVILIGGFLLNLLVRIVIRRMSTKIANGETAKLEKLDADTIGKNIKDPRYWLMQDSPIAAVRRAQRAQTIGSVLRSIATVVIGVMTILMVMTELGFDLGPLLASAGIAGVAIGFGAQTLVKDYLSGLFMVAEDQYGIGDVVDLGEASGTVESVGLRVTQVRSVDGTLWHVRNGEILRVGNSSQGWARAVLDIPVPYDSDVEKVSDLILSSAKDLRSDPDYRRLILDDPEIWGVEALTGESVVIRLAIRTKPLEQWGVARAMRARLKGDLDRAGLRIPLLNQTVIKDGSPVLVPAGSESHADASAGASASTPDESR
ncbi:mechanosensitive ion channel family protein [Arthrobacter sp. VKM Ac-2550]|uniref:mechanosensitive ion channel family protein n=1 Tax=Crystallibacter permensis TaxID=1938888 RepID=UPI00222626F7|nr:mechanosensitive ion channel family protein [Arthrobacter sp. VKM Ac-2550]